jgi:hypothetical protein
MNRQEEYEYIMKKMKFKKGLIKNYNYHLTTEKLIMNVYHKYINNVLFHVGYYSPFEAYIIWTKDIKNNKLFDIIVKESYQIEQTLVLFNVGFLQNV